MKKPVGKVEVRVTKLSKKGVETIAEEIKQLIEDYAEKKMLYGCVEVKVVSE